MKSDFAERESITGTIPMLTRERQYGFWDVFLATSGFAIATWCYTQGAYVAEFMTFRHLLINVFCFNIVWLLVECVPVFFAVRYGIDLWIWLRSVLGFRGVTAFVLIISVANLGWYAVNAQLFSSSMIELAGYMGVSIAAPIVKTALGILCVFLGTLTALGGPTAIKWTSRILVTALLLVGLVVVGLCLTAVPFEQIMAVKPTAQGEPLVNFMLSAEGNVAFAFSWSTLVLVLPRLCNSESKGFWATHLSYAVIAPFFVAAGGVMALAMYLKTGVYESDPTKMLAVLSGPGAALLSLLMVAFANIGTQGIGSYAISITIKSGLPKLPYRLIVLFIFCYVSALTVWGWVMENFGAFVSLAAYIQGPLIGIVFVDYLFVKRRKIALRDAYALPGHNAYRFTHGFNLVGIAAILISFVSCMLWVYNPITGTIHSRVFMVLTGSGYSAVCGGLLYYLAFLSPLRRYMLPDRNNITVV